MNAVDRTCRLAVVLGAFAMGCGGGDDDNKSVMDAGLDSGTATGDGGVTCNSLIRPANGMCGGAHCKETEAQLRAATPTTATCGADMEVASFCSLDAIEKVGSCARSNFAAGEEATRTCARTALSTLSHECVDCFLKSAACAGEKCLTECFAGDSLACDQCRVTKGCISSFYSCSGYRMPSL